MRHHILGENERGFSLLDVILACVLFGTIAVGVNQVLQSYSRATAKGRSLLVATQLAERVMERQLGLGYSAVTLPRDEFRMVQTTYGDPQQIAYWYEVQVNDLSDTASDLNLGLREIQVSVGWSETNQERQLTISSMVYWDG